LSGYQEDTHLSDFFRRVLFRKGRIAAVNAPARKLAGLYRITCKKTTLQSTNTIPVFRPKRKLGLIKK